MKSWTVAIAAVCLALPAQAWDGSGFYAGLNAGLAAGGDAGGDYGIHLFPEHSTFVDTPIDLSSSFVLGGVGIGYDWKRSGIIFGIAADVQATSFDESAITEGHDYLFIAPGHWETDHYPGTTYKASQKMDWLGTVRGRAGAFLLDNTLVYGTVGLAFGRVANSALLAYPSGMNYAIRDTSTQIGFALGAGAEQRIGRDWSLKAEYLYFDLGQDRIIGEPGSNPDYASAGKIDQPSGHILRLGINRHF